MKDSQSTDNSKALVDTDPKPSQPKTPNEAAASQSSVASHQSTDEQRPSKQDDQHQKSATTRTRASQKGEPGDEPSGKPNQAKNENSRNRRNDRSSRREARPEQRRDRDDRKENPRNNGKNHGGRKHPEHTERRDSRKPRKNRWQDRFVAASQGLEEAPVTEPLFTWEPLETAASALSFLAENLNEETSPLDFNELYTLPATTLLERATKAFPEHPEHSGKRQLLGFFLKAAATTQRPIAFTGTLELSSEGFGFIVFSIDNYRIMAGSPFISAALINHYKLERGHSVSGMLFPAPQEEVTCPVVLRIDTIMGKDPATVRNLPSFNDLIPSYPSERLTLETASNSGQKSDNISTRLLDLFSPVGLGQRGLIIAPPRTGKTALLHAIANSICLNKPEVTLLIVLIDARPEDVIEFQRKFKAAETIASTFDESPETHIHLSEMAIEKARRLVEIGEDVVILLDSITRLGRAWNTIAQQPGGVHSRRVQADALHPAKQLFGSARNTEQGGSLTILATALADTGSKIDEAIVDEFRRAANMELHLDRELAKQNVFPAIALEKTGTQNEELLYDPETLDKVRTVRQAMTNLPAVEAMEMLIQGIRRTESNPTFLKNLQD